MIVKNESARIRQTLESVLPYIDSWCIVDTGSTDDTVEIIKSCLSNVPGHLIRHPIITYLDTDCIDYAATRNMALEYASNNSTFIFLMSGDEILQNGESLRTFCEEAKEKKDYDAHYVQLLGSSRGSYDQIRLLRSNANLRYTFPTHEYIFNAKNIGQRILNVSINSFSEPYEKSCERWERDIKVLYRYMQNVPGNYLTKESEDSNIGGGRRLHGWRQNKTSFPFKEALSEKPEVSKETTHLAQNYDSGDRNRAIFYLAQSYECLGNNDLAFEYYEKRSKMGGWSEEVYEAKKRMAQCADRLKIVSSKKFSWEEVKEMYLETYSFRPERLEAIYEIAKHYYDEKNFSLCYLYALIGLDCKAPEQDVLFVDREVYTWKLADLVSASAWNIGKKEIGLKAAKKAYRANSEDKRLQENYYFYRDNS